MIDTTLDVPTAARRYLASIPEVTDLLGSSETYATWIFRWKPYETIEGTGKAALVLSQRPGLAANQHNTMRFPRLQVEIFVDPPRNDSGNPLSSTLPEDRAWQIALVLDKYLHTVNPDDGGDAMTWGDESGSARILRSTRGTDIDIMEVPGGDGMIRGLVSYEVSLG